MKRGLAAAFALAALAACVFPAPRLPIPPDASALAQAARLLRAPELAVEIDWIPGCAPSVQTQEGIRAFLERYAKPERGVRLVLDEEIRELAPGVPIPENRMLSALQIHELARRHRSLVVTGGAESIYLLFIPLKDTDGSGQGERGEAFVSESFAVVATERVRQEGFLAIQGNEVERFVVQHELGHLLGLVSNESHARAGHCTNPVCIMYPQPDLRAVLANWWRALIGQLPTELDADCEHDLERLREGARPRASAMMSRGAMKEQGTAGPHAARGWAPLEAPSLRAPSSTIPSGSL
ncbi:MAG TPA: hypothetical protein DEP35_08320 [Deltaproteobacteria bacterium]|nr:hypothetical protein [Deltaproteobacteria bacterium]